MYSCDQERAATRAAFSASSQPCSAARSLHHSTQPGQTPAVASASAAAQPRRDKKRHAARPPSTSRRRSSTTVVATDVANFRAMVQELTGFPPAAIFRPLPRRVHTGSPVAAVHGCGGGSSGGGGGALHGHSSSDTATTACGDHSPGVPTVQAQPLTQPGVFDGPFDIGSPEFDSWPDLSFE